MASKRGKDVDAEVDLHGLTAVQMRQALERRWQEWRGLRCVRIIHGRGEILRPEVHGWCHDRGILCELEPNNPGSTKIYPSQRTLPEPFVGVTLAEKGLRLTPEQEALLRDPQAAERARQEALKRRKEEEARKRADAALQAAQGRRDESLWQAEMRRLDTMERKRSGGVSPGAKPLPPRILAPAEIKYQEGYWRSELVRVADTDTDTLKKEKRTGLDKLAPPMPERPIAAREPEQKPRPQRDTEADRRLFEAELARLDDTDPN